MAQTTSRVIRFGEPGSKVDAMLDLPPMGTGMRQVVDAPAYTVYAVRDNVPRVDFMLSASTLEEAAELVEQADLEGTWPEGFDAVAVDGKGQAYEDVAGNGKFVCVGDNQFVVE